MVGKLSRRSPTREGLEGGSGIFHVGGEWSQWGRKEVPFLLRGTLACG